jgi:enoyl-CoA hydratase/carnithine racemase
MPSLSREHDVFVLDLGESENRFNAELFDSLESCLDEVEAAPAPRALVTAASGKHWSIGLDLDWLGAQGEGAKDFIVRMQQLLARVLEIGVPTVAALQGHTFAGGAMFALAHDQRVMRADRGFFCLPEVDINIAFTEGMSTMIAARLPQPARHEAMTTGRRYGGVEAAAAGIVDEAVQESQVRSRAIERAAAQAAKGPEVLTTIKQRLYRDALAALRAPIDWGQA